MENFIKALEALAPTNKARAKVLGVSMRRVQDWRAGRVPDLLVKVASHPDLLEALAKDGEGGQG